MIKKINFGEYIIMKTNQTVVTIFFGIAAFLQSSCAGTNKKPVKTDKPKPAPTAVESFSSNENPLGCFRMGKSYELAAASKKEFAVFEQYPDEKKPGAEKILTRSYSFNDKCDRDIDMSMDSLGYVDQIKITGSSVTVQNVMPGEDGKVYKGTFSRRDADSFLLNAPDKGPQYFVKVK